MDAAIARVAAPQFGLITRAQLLALGLSSRAICNRIAKGRLQVIHPAVYAVAGAPPTWDQQLMAALLATGPDDAISHLSAGAFWKVGGITAVRPDVLLVHPRRLRLTGVIVHRSRTIESGDVVCRPPFRVTSAARTLMDLAGVVSQSQLEDAVDDCLRRRLVVVERLSERIVRLDGPVPGIRRLRAVVADREKHGPHGTAAQRIFAGRLRRSGLPEPAREYRITEASGRFVARADLAYPDAKLAIEIDGGHHADHKQWKLDVERQNRLVLQGWRFLRFTNDEACHDPRAIDAVAAALGTSAVTT